MIFVRMHLHKILFLVVLKETVSYVPTQPVVANFPKQYTAGFICVTSMVVSLVDAGPHSWMCLSILFGSTVSRLDWKVEPSDQDLTLILLSNGL